MEAEFEIPQQVNNGMYIATGVEECMVLILFVGLVLFLASQIYRYVLYGLRHLGARHLGADIWARGHLGARHLGAKCVLAHFQHSFSTTFQKKFFGVSVLIFSNFLITNLQVISERTD